MCASIGNAIATISIPVSAGMRSMAALIRSKAALPAMARVLVTRWEITNRLTGSTPVQIWSRFKSA